MLDKTQDCSADQVSTPEMTSRELLNELLKAELRQLRIRNLVAEEKLIADATLNFLCSTRLKIAPPTVACPLSRARARPL
jgi:hypothetical protein